MNYQIATLEEIPLLAQMNRQLVEDEQHRHRLMSNQWLEERMRQLMAAGYEAALFEIEGRFVAYALYRQHPDHEDSLYLRHFWVDRSLRRQGVGRAAMRILKNVIWPAEKRITVEVLIDNETARSFFQAAGFKPYSLELELPASERDTWSE